jgi:glucoside 3-dehydrogenase (cytochrome c) catalytic subunit
MGGDTASDAIVVGSGASGGWAAKVLTEAGLRVLMLEAGPHRVPERDFTEHVKSYEVSFRGLGDRKKLSRDQPVQSLCYACDEYSSHFFVNDNENPYTTPDGKPFVWIRGRQVGGKTYCWARESYRFSDYELKAASRDGYGQDWPFDYAEIAPYYDKVESFIGVSGSRDGFPQFPDGRFLPPMKMSCGEVLAQKIIEARFHRKLVIDRVANLTAPLNGRTPCHYCDACQRGCSTQSYFNSPAFTIAAAAETGRLVLRSEAVVSSVTIDDRGRATGVRYVDRLSNEHREARAQVVILAASTIESTRIMLNSKSAAHPAGIANGSGLVGHYLMDHFTIPQSGGVMPMLTTDVREPVGRPCATVMPRYQNLESRDRRFLRGYRYDLWAGQEHFEHAFRTPGFGGGFKKSVRSQIPVRVTMGAQGECLPRHENHVRLDPEKVDAWGIPVVHISASYGEHEHAQARAMADDVNEMVKAMGVEGMKEARPEPSTFGLNIHEVGTVRMGNDPKTSVLNRYNQAHEVKNLFVTDGACFPSQGPYEPTLTIMAVTVRACEYLIEEHRRGNLA